MGREVLEHRATWMVAVALGVSLAAFAAIIAIRGVPARHAEAAVGTTVGCTFVPDSGPWFNFKSACDSHDACYVHHWLDKVGCDWRFYTDMNNYCARTYQWWQWQRSACFNTAATYYAGVSTVGWACYARWIAC